MSQAAVGNTIEAVLDAVRAHLRSDATLRASVTGIYEQLPEAERIAYPYTRLSGPMLDSHAYGAMGAIGTGGRLTFAVDTWSQAKGPHEVRQIMAAIKVLLLRVDLDIAGHRIARGSLITVEEQDFDEPDPDMPEKRLWHGHQTWALLLEES